jgi:hypothetical protein
MTRMPAHFCARDSLFLYVNTHPQLQYYLHLGETEQAANQGVLQAVQDWFETGNVIDIHPIGASVAPRHPR